MSRYSIEEFVSQTKQKDQGQGTFELETERLLELNLNGSMWTKMGSMVSYRGNVKFTREGILEQGFGNLLEESGLRRGNQPDQGRRAGHCLPS